SASADGTVKLWDAFTSQEFIPLRGHSSTAQSVAYCPSGQWLASAGADHTVRVWDAATAREVFVLRGHEDVVRAVAFAPTGSLLASAGEDRTVRLWDAATGKQVDLLCGLPGPTWPAGLAFSPDGIHLAAAADGRDRAEKALSHQVKV